VERDAIMNFENNKYPRRGKPFTSSLSICHVERGIGAGGVRPSPLNTTLFPSYIFVDISFEDDVTVILLLGVSFMIWNYGQERGDAPSWNFKMRIFRCLSS
jgi:hypothetical protein